MDLNFKKKIEHPSEYKVGISLIPIGFLIIYVVATHSFPMWVLIGMVATFAL